MSAREWIVYVLIAAGVGLEVVACLGTVAMRGVYDRLHYVGPSVLGAVLLAAGIWVDEGPSIIALKALLLAALLSVTSPTLAHATARAARISELGDWPRQRDEGIEVEE